jgi:D-alanyl-D-alanine dipeptidase
MPLVDIRPPDHDVVLDIRYATADNLTGRPIYARPLCYLHPEAAQALRRAIELARPLGLRLRLFDGFRPVEAQWRLWNAVPNPEFVADPRKGSSHSRGVAIDLTLDGPDGRPLDMGTGFDAVTPLSHHGNLEISATAQRNRLLLLGLMAAAGWQHYQNEWWHYNLPQPERFPMLSDSVLDGIMMAPAA